MLKIEAAADAPSYPLYLELKAVLESMREQAAAEEPALILSFGEAVSLSLEGSRLKPLQLDFLKGRMAARLFKGGAREIVVKAVLGRKSLADASRLTVFDATAGLGRESLLLARAGLQVTMFERHPVVYALLKDALARAQSALQADPVLADFALPKLAPLGAYKDQAAAWPRPDLIYYDPMFPEKKKSAEVKGEMQYFHRLIGFDEDVTDNLQAFCKLALKKVVLKRPVSALPLSVESLKPAYSLDGGVNRFDVYLAAGTSALKADA